MATNFLHLATTLEYLGAKCLPKKKVNFVPCMYTQNNVDNLCGIYSEL